MSIAITTPRAKQITPQMALVERARRELARRKYADFRDYMAPWYQRARHNLLLAAKLEEVELYIRTEGEQGIGRLIVCEPPRYGKSEDVARLFPTWVLGKNPDKRIAVTSYAASLSDGHSRQIRNYVMGDRFAAIFGHKSVMDTPVEISDDSASKSDWDLAEPNRGGVVSRGIGGGLSGKGAHLLVIDDPTKDAEEARSEDHQRKVMDWYQSVALQRLEKGSAVIIVQTRWNPNDLVGQLLKLMGGTDPDAEQWEVVFLPALALQEDEYPKTMDDFTENLLRGIYIPLYERYEATGLEKSIKVVGDQLGRKPGEALWPWKFPLEVVEQKKSKVSPFFFAALDQQLPRAFSGGFFDESDIKIMEPAAVPENVTWCAYVDLALGNSKKSDLNAVMPFTMDPKTGDYIYRDLVHERDLNRFMMLLKMEMRDPRNKRVIWGIESVAFQTLVFNEFRKDPLLAAVAMVKIVPNESKEDRATNVSVRSKGGHLWLVRGAWNQTAIRELLDFPFGRHDDIVDTVSGGPFMYAKYGSGEKKKAGSHQG
jgi:phage terminase large subunit-like protein